MSILALACAFCMILSLTVTATGSATTTTIPYFKSRPNPPYPIGIPDGAEPSGEAPPDSSTIDGYTLSYVNDFTATSLPSGWFKFSGQPGGDPGARFEPSHVVVGAGMLSLLTYRDTSWYNRWATGGVCQCGLAHTYGAYFVRSRVSAPGPNEVELLWPNQDLWPPEIDFDETGGLTTELSASLHYGATNHLNQIFLGINMTKWHTWGVIWTPTTIIYTIDGQVWGTMSVASEIPTIPMTLDMEQRTKCTVNKQCPAHPVSMQVDWVAEYTPNTPNTGNVAPNLIGAKRTAS